jgi:hypothetical protein
MARKGTNIYKRKDGRLINACTVFWALIWTVRKKFSGFGSLIIIDLDGSGIDTISFD